MFFQSEYCRMMVWDYMDQQLYNLKPNARWGEAYEKLAEILYGEA